MGPLSHPPVCVGVLSWNAPHTKPRQTQPQGAPPQATHWVEFDTWPLLRGSSSSPSPPSLSLSLCPMHLCDDLLHQHHACVPSCFEFFIPRQTCVCPHPHLHDHVGAHFFTELCEYPHPDDDHVWVRSSCPFSSEHYCGPVTSLLWCPILVITRVPSPCPLFLPVSPPPRSCVSRCQLQRVPFFSFSECCSSSPPCMRV